jgi:hypothetical protein
MLMSLTFVSTWDSTASGTSPGGASGDPLSRSARPWSRSAKLSSCRVHSGIIWGWVSNAQPSLRATVAGKVQLKTRSTATVPLDGAGRAVGAMLAAVVRVQATPAAALFSSRPR